jgi:RNA-directed DNA polymerase
MILERMSAELSVPLKYVERMVRSASYQYKEYPIQKRGGGVRMISHPSRKLKALQRWLLVNVVQTWPVHPAAMAYRPGVSIFDNATRHATSKYLLRMDMREFFPSIRASDMQTFAARRPNLFTGWTAQDADGFSRLVFRSGRLTIGAPTSPGVSNALCADLDATLDAMCFGYGVTYTRYADDLFFSTSVKGVLADVQTRVEGIVAGSDLPGNLTINAQKTKHSSKRGARRVTGIVLGSDNKPHVSRETKRYIRSLVNKVETLDPATRMRLAGLISYVTGFEPAFLNSLILKYGAASVETAMAGPSDE